MSAADDIINTIKGSIEFRLQRGFWHAVRATASRPGATLAEIKTLEDRCALLENQVAQAEQALALERAAHADLQRRFEKVMDRIHVFGERI